VEIFLFKKFVVRFRIGGRAVVSNQQYSDDICSFLFVTPTKKSCKNFFVSSRWNSFDWDTVSLLITVGVGDGTINESDSTSIIKSRLNIISTLF